MRRVHWWKVVGVLSSLLLIVVLIRDTVSDTAAHLEGRIAFAPFRLPPEFEQLHGQLTDAASLAAILEEESVAADGPAEGRLLRGLAGRFARDLDWLGRMASERDAAIFELEIENTGSRPATNVELALPHAENALVIREGAEPDYQRDVRVIPLGRLEARERATVQVWTLSSVARTRLLDLRLRHDEGIGDISVRPTVGEVLLERHPYLVGALGGLCLAGGLYALARLGVFRSLRKARSPAETRTGPEVEEGRTAPS